MDGTSWGTPVAEGEGKGQSTVITFAPVRAKYVRITQTGTAEPPTDAATRAATASKLVAGEEMVVTSSSPMPARASARRRRHCSR